MGIHRNVAGVRAWVGRACRRFTLAAGRRRAWWSAFDQYFAKCRVRPRNGVVDSDGHQLLISELDRGTGRGFRHVDTPEASVLDTKCGEGIASSSNARTADCLVRHGTAAFFHVVAIPD